MQGDLVMRFIEKNRSVIVWGAGNVGSQIVKKYSSYYNIKFIVDNKVPVNQKEKLLNIPVYNPVILKKREFWKDAVLVLCLVEWHGLKKQLDSYNLKIIRDFIPWNYLDYVSITPDFFDFFESDNEKKHYISVLAKDKKICLLYGMCHMSIYKHFLMHSKDFFDKYVLLDIPIINDMENQYHNIFKSDFLWSNCDLLIANVIQPSISNHYDSPCTKDVIKKLKNSCKTILIPDVAFRGYFPQHTVGNKKTNKYFAWGDKNINKMIKQNKSLDDIERKILLEDFYDYEFVNKYFYKSLEMLQSDEKECDIKISDYIEENGKRKVLFYSWTHPKEEVMLEIGKRIFSVLNLNKNILDELSNDIVLNTNEELIYPCVLKALGIEDADTFMTERRMNPSHLWKDNLLASREYIYEYVSMNSSYIKEDKC